MTDYNTGSITFVPSKQQCNLSFDSKIIDEYIIGDSLGAGSCAVVRLGVHRVTGEQVAVKIVKPSTMQKQKELLREIEALRVLKDHPHIVKLLKVIRENGFVCLILELGKGGELFNFIVDNGRLTEVHARKIFRQVLSAVQYSHAHLIVHRDLKPENIILDSNGDAKVSDFGLSNFFKPNLLFSTFCGSPIYTSPEIVLHRKYNGSLADVWSLGVILFVMVTGGMPWRLENNKVQNLEQLLAAQFKLPDSLGLTEGVKNLIRMMLTAESRDRATIEAIVQHPWVCEGFDQPPNAFLPKQPLVALQDIDYDLVNQLSMLSMDVPSAIHAIQNDSTSPALNAYRCLLGKQSRMLKVTENVIIGDLSQNPPLSPSRQRAKSDPMADRLKIEKTRLEKLKQECEKADEGREKFERERIREKIRKWKAMHKSSEGPKNSAIVHQVNGVVYVETFAAPDKKTESKHSFKNFFTYFKRPMVASTPTIKANTKDSLPLKNNSSPVSRRG